METFPSSFDCVVLTQNRQNPSARLDIRTLTRRGSCVSGRATAGGPGCRPLWPWGRPPEPATGVHSPRRFCGPGSPARRPFPRSAHRDPLARALTMWRRVLGGVCTQRTLDNACSRCSLVTDPGPDADHRGARGGGAAGCGDGPEAAGLPEKRVPLNVVGRSSALLSHPPNRADSGGWVQSKGIVPRGLRRRESGQPGPLPRGTRTFRAAFQ